MLGAKEPIEDERITDGACDRCCKAMKIDVACRWCGEPHTVQGLCIACEFKLERQMGRPNIELSVFRSGGGPMVGAYDGAGFMLRLKAAMDQPDYCGFAMRRVAAEVPA